ncbi:hypothetical protein DFH08DRAFT_704876, partial [Mycena albidolilacea]
LMTAGTSGFSIIQGLSSTLDTVLPGAWNPGPPRSQPWSAFGPIEWFIFVAWFEVEPILLWLRQDPEVARLADISLLGLHWPPTLLTQINCEPHCGTSVPLQLRRYFQSQVGLFTVPTRIIMIVAPLNALLNWLLVFGPEPIRFGYIGAPIVTAGMNLSFNMVSLLSVGYGIVFLPEWTRARGIHPMCRRNFQNLGILFHFGMAGVGLSVSFLCSSALTALPCSSNGVGVVSDFPIFYPQVGVGYPSSIVYTHPLNHRCRTHSTRRLPVCLRI